MKKFLKETRSKLKGSERREFGSLTQTAYIIDPFDGTPVASKPLSVPTPAALGDFNPDNNLYYGLNFDIIGEPEQATFIVVVDLQTGEVTTLGLTVDDLHTLAFVEGR